MTGLTCANCGGIEELSHFRSGSKRYEFHLCRRCGNEWTVTIENEPEASEPITSVEILGVHEQLSNPDFKLSDL